MSLANDLREKLNTDTGTIRVAIYARVSTDNDGQKESCANQVELAMKFVTNHPNIQIIGTYVDDGISGKNDFTRPKYNEMLQQISAGNIDLIITKALSRLNRDEFNSLYLKNMLLQTETTVYTLEDNQIHDFEDLNSGIMHSLTFAMDAQYVMRQSLSGKKTQELRCERKELSAKDCQSYGYTWHKDTKTITVNPEEADVVRKIFEEYVYRNGTPASIERMLKADGIKMCSRSISNLIQDERYIGNFYINKRTSKIGTGQTKSKRIQLPKEQWVLVERPDLQIVDTDLFDMAQRIHQTRITVYEKPDKKTTQARFQGIHKYAGKIFCPVCGKPYHFGYSDRAKTKPIYEIKGHSDCPNPVRRITEPDLEEITRQALKRTIDQQNEVCQTLEAVLTECVQASQNNGNEIAKLKQQIKTKNNQLNNLIDELSEGGLIEAAKDRIKAKINTITEEIDNLTEIIKDKESNKLSVSYVSDKIAEIKSAIAELRNFTEIDRDRILNYIERIELPANGDVNMLLKSGQVITIVTTENSDFSEGDSVVKNGKQDDLYSYSGSYPVPPVRALPLQ